MLPYAYDMVVTCTSSTQIEWLIQQLGHQFSIKDLGHLHHFLDIEVHRLGPNMFLT